MEGRWHCGEVTHDRCHGHVFHPPYFFSNWPSAQEQRLLTNRKKEGGKLGKAKAAAPTQQSAGPDAKPSTQSPHMLLWPAALGWLKSPANPHPHRQASHCPQAFLSMPPLSFTVLMTRHKLPHIHPSRAKIITLQLTTGMRTKLGHRRGFA